MSGDEVFRNGSAENCPDCGGELQYQNRVAVLCLECGTDFEHFHTTTEHQLFTVADDEPELEIVATAPIESREVATDGGTDGTERPSGTEGEVFDLVDRKGPITLKDLMKHIGAFSRDEVIRCLKSLESDGYVVEEEVEFEYGGIEQTRDEWSVNTGADA